MIFYDTESCGLHGFAVLIQYAIDDGPVQLFEPWREPIYKTLDLIEQMMEHDVVGFNLTFDHFHLCKLYTTFSLYPDKDAEPQDIVNELALLEPKARDGLCVKPKRACDLMLWARKGKYQSTMERKPIHVRRVPTELAWQLADELERRVALSDFYFARKKNPSDKHWKVEDIKGTTAFKNIVLRFAPSIALKVLAADALGHDKNDILLFKDIEVDKVWRPKEFGYAPFALAVGTPENWNWAWPQVIQKHIDHWAYHKQARSYAEKDVEYTRALYKHFDSPEPGDDDSELACMVGASRWRGYKVDVEKLKELKIQASKRLRKFASSPRIVYRYLKEVLTEEELEAMKGSTKKTVLEAIAKESLADCPQCSGNGGNEDCQCKGTGIVKSEASKRATEVLEARKAGKEMEIYDKLILAGRFHASFKIIGALSSRMSGADGLNAQGIKKTKDVRSCFPLAWPGYQLIGGDFKSFEVTIADAVYDDPVLRKDLLTCGNCGCEMARLDTMLPVSQVVDDLESYISWRSKAETKAAKKDPDYQPKDREAIVSEILGNDFYCKHCGYNEGKSIHGLFGVNVYPDMTYDQILATKGTADDKYTRCKSAVFAMLYGGTGFTLKERLGVEIETAEKAYELFNKKYRGAGREAKRVSEMFSALHQPDGIGSRIYYKTPADYIESIFGFRRYFNLENQVIKTLFDLAEKPPEAWTAIKIKVQRRKEGASQYVGGAVRSAVFGAAFGIQSGNIRAGKNHRIQSSGAQATKKLQRRIWDIQPSGIGDWIVQPMNVHDEIMNPTLPEYVPIVHQTVKDLVEELRPTIPLVGIDWSNDLETWADK